MNKDIKQKFPVPAATVILTRQHTGELQVYLLKRSVKSGFMAGKYVFPGGTVDGEDAKFDLWKAHVDLDSNGLLRHLGGDLTEAEILAYAVAAIRETLEEAGVFLAHRHEETKQPLERICRLRMSGDLPKGWFIKSVASEDWTLAVSALSRWSHWITPELMKRRYDTRFFTACLPPGQQCQPDTRETTDGLWVSPEKGLAGNLAGQIPLSPPTLITLHELLKYPSLQDLERDTGNRQWGETYLPRLIPLDKGAVIIEPWDPQYNQEEIEINIDELKKSVLPVGKSFSRIWYHEGLWRPVGY
jgi:8-oxo-dGTP pyrophosphatase MutT (NUDIX family)